MRRMITTKHQELLQKLDEQIDVGNFETNISGTGYLLLNSTPNKPTAQISVSEDAIELKIYNENTGDMESVITVGAEGYIRFTPLLPTSEPGIEGVLWNDKGTLKVSGAE